QPLVSRTAVSSSRCFQTRRRTTSFHFQRRRYYLRRCATMSTGSTCGGRTCPLIVATTVVPSFPPPSRQMPTGMCLPSLPKTGCTSPCPCFFASWCANGSSRSSSARSPKCTCSTENRGGCAGREQLLPRRATEKEIEAKGRSQSRY
ncbi:unnamed protein product, partial [Amoebophrya sp. A120]